MANSNSNSMLYNNINNDAEDLTIIKATNMLDLSSIPRTGNCIPEILFENKRKNKSILEDLESEDITDGGLAEKNNSIRNYKSGKLLYQKSKSQPSTYTPNNNTNLTYNSKNITNLSNIDNEKCEKLDNMKKLYSKEDSISKACNNKYKKLSDIDIKIHKAKERKALNDKEKMEKLKQELKHDYNTLMKYGYTNSKANDPNERKLKAKEYSNQVSFLNKTLLSNKNNYDNSNINNTNLNNTYNPNNYNNKSVDNAITNHNYNNEMNKTNNTNNQFMNNTNNSNFQNTNILSNNNNNDNNTASSYGVRSQSDNFKYNNYIGDNKANNNNFNQQNNNIDNISRDNAHKLQEQSNNLLNNDKMNKTKTSENEDRPKKNNFMEDSVKKTKSINTNNSNNQKQVTNPTNPVNTYNTNNNNSSNMLNINITGSTPHNNLNQQQINQQDNNNLENQQQINNDVDQETQVKEIKDRRMQYLVDKYRESRIKQLQKEFDLKQKELNEKNLKKLKALKEANKLDSLYAEEEPSINNNNNNNNLNKVEENQEENLVDNEGFETNENNNEENNEENDNRENTKNNENTENNETNNNENHVNNENNDDDENDELLKLGQELDQENTDINDNNNNKDNNNENENNDNVLYNNYINKQRSQSDNKENTKNKKQHIDNREFLRKINENRRILRSQLADNNDNADDINLHNNHNEENNNNINNSRNQISNSFRKQNSKSNHSRVSQNSRPKSSSNPIINPDNKTAEVFDESGNYLFSYKTNKRNKDELYAYMQERRMKEREKKVTSENKQKEEEVDRFIKLLNIENKQRNLCEQIKNRKSNTRQTKSANSKNIRNDQYSNQKENYISKNNLNNLDESSFIDENEYKMAMYEFKVLYQNATTGNKKKDSSNNNNIIRNSSNNVTYNNSNREDNSNNDINNNNINQNYHAPIIMGQSKSQIKNNNFINTNNLIGNNTSNVENPFRNNIVGIDTNNTSNNKFNNNAHTRVSNSHAYKNTNSNKNSNNDIKKPVKPNFNNNINNSANNKNNNTNTTNQYNSSNTNFHTAGFEKPVENKEEFINLLENQKKKCIVNSLESSYSNIVSAKLTPNNGDKISPNNNNIPKQINPNKQNQNTQGQNNNNIKYNTKNNDHLIQQNQNPINYEKLRPKSQDEKTASSDFNIGLDSKMDEINDKINDEIERIKKHNETHQNNPNLISNENRYDNIIVDKNTYSPKNSLNAEKEKTEKKFNEILNKSKSRDMSMSNANVSKTYSNNNVNASHNYNPMLTDEENYNNTQNNLHTNTNLSNNNNLSIKASSQDNHLADNENNNNNTQDNDNQDIDLDNLEPDVAATILQNYMKHVYLKKIQNDQKAYLEQENMNPNNEHYEDNNEPTDYDNYRKHTSDERENRPMNVQELNIRQQYNNNSTTNKNNPTENDNKSDIFNDLDDKFYKIINKNKLEEAHELANKSKNSNKSNLTNNTNNKNNISSNDLKNASNNQGRNNNDLNNSKKDIETNNTNNTNNENTYGFNLNINADLSEKEIRTDSLYNNNNNKKNQNLNINITDDNNNTPQNLDINNNYNYNENSQLESGLKKSSSKNIGLKLKDTGLGRLNTSNRSLKSIDHKSIKDNINKSLNRSRMSSVNNSRIEGDDNNYDNNKSMRSNTFKPERENINDSIEKKSNKEIKNISDHKENNSKDTSDIRIETEIENDNNKEIPRDNSNIDNNKSGNSNNDNDYNATNKSDANLNMSYVSREISHFSDSLHACTFNGDQLSDESEVILSPNSIGSPRLHKIYEMLAKERGEELVDEVELYRQEYLRNKIASDLHDQQEHEDIKVNTSLISMNNYSDKKASSHGSKFYDNEKEDDDGKEKPLIDVAANKEEDKANKEDIITNNNKDEYDEYANEFDNHTKENNLTDVKDDNINSNVKDEDINIPSQKNDNKDIDTNHNKDKSIKDDDDLIDELKIDSFDEEDNKNLNNSNNKLNEDNNYDRKPLISDDSNIKDTELNINNKEVKIDDNKDNKEDNSKLLDDNKKEELKVSDNEITSNNYTPDDTENNDLHSEFHLNKDFQSRRSGKKSQRSTKNKSKDNKTDSNIESKGESRNDTPNIYFDKDTKIDSNNFNSNKDQPADPSLNNKFSNIDLDAANQKNNNKEKEENEYEDKFDNFDDNGSAEFGKSSEDVSNNRFKNLQSQASKYGNSNTKDSLYSESNYKPGQLTVTRSDIEADKESESIDWVYSLNNKPLSSKDVKDNKEKEGYAHATTNSFNVNPQENKEVPSEKNEKSIPNIDIISIPATNIQPEIDSERSRNNNKHSRKPSQDNNLIVEENPHKSIESSESKKSKPSNTEGKDSFKNKTDDSSKSTDKKFANELNTVELEEKLKGLNIKNNDTNTMSIDCDPSFNPLNFQNTNLEKDYGPSSQSKSFLMEEYKFRNVLDDTSENPYSTISPYNSQKILNPYDPKKEKEDIIKPIAHHTIEEENARAETENSIKSDKLISKLDKKPEILEKDEANDFDKTEAKDNDEEKDQLKEDDKQDKEKEAELKVENEINDELTPEEEAYIEELAEDMINDLVDEVVLQPNNLFPKKAFKKDLNDLSNSMYSSSYEMLNLSMVSCVSISSVKTIAEEKKEISNKLYESEISPLLVKQITEEIVKNADGIINNIKKPFTSNPLDLTLSLLLGDYNGVLKSYKVPPTEYEENKAYINKSKIINEFNPINKEIRQQDNILSDNYYDNIVNECFIDAANELIEKERHYKGNPEPLIWSNRTKTLRFKHNNTTFSKNNFSKKIKSELDKSNNTKMGMISENYEYENEVLINEREKRMLSVISNEINEAEGNWNNYDIEETAIKLELTELVLDQLLNEVVEIMEHVNLSRVKPHLYQDKSIYACEDIPKLSFQQTTETDMMDNINQ